MKLAPLFLLFAAALGAQDLSFTLIQDPGGNTVNQTLDSPYSFPNTSVGNSSGIVIRVTNLTSAPITIDSIFFDSNVSVFPISGEREINAQLNQAGLKGDFEDVNVGFVPNILGEVSASLQVEYEVPSGSKVYKTIMVSTFSGTGTPTQIASTYSLGGATYSLTPLSTIDFGNTSTTSVTATFSLMNKTTAPIPLTISINSDNADNTNPAFSATVSSCTTGGSLSSCPITVGANSTSTFIVTFAPGQNGLLSATLGIGTNSYTLNGTGVNLLQIVAVDSSGVKQYPEVATPIGFAQTIEGSSDTLTFTVTNPPASSADVNLSSVSVSPGTAFSASGVPPLPVSLVPGASVQFQVTFAPLQTGALGGQLIITTTPPSGSPTATLTFSLTGIGADLPIPTASLVFDTTNFTSQQQPHISVQFASPSTITAIGTLTMQFTSSVANVQDDPAVKFLATSGRSLQVTVAVGGASATYNGQSELTFQTGTTAGTILFTLTFPNKQPITQQITIAPALVQITQMTAVAQDPFLVVTMTGYDNTYSTGPMTFNFYDTTGKVIASNMAVNATPNFQQYFGATTSGGAFAIQLSFPTSGGSISSVGSVSATMSNSVGTSTLSQANF